MKCLLCGKDAKIENINGFVQKISCKDCGTYFVELPFLELLTTFLDKYGKDAYNSVVAIMKRQVKNNIVVFTCDFRHPYYDNENVIYLELEDLASLAGIVMHDINSRIAGGS